MKRKPFLFLLLFCMGCPLAQAATIDTLSIRSASMNRDIQVVVIAPSGAGSSSGRLYPVFYLLHGHGGNAHDWRVVMPDLPHMVDRDGVIAVCPDGKTSWYWDSPRDSSIRYETFVSQELIDYIDSHYPTVADRAGRAVTGWSMGGHGAMWLSMRHKDRFGAAGSSSGGVDIRPFPDNWNMKDALGEKSGNEDRWDAHTAINQIDSIQNGDLALIVDCGCCDFFFEVNQNFHNRLLERGIGHDYVLRPGVHEAGYWINSLVYQWLFFRKFFEAAVCG